MIGPSSGSEPTDEAHHLHLYNHQKRRALEELDIESICDEVCGHQHNLINQQSVHKKPRLDLQQIGDLLDHDVHHAIYTSGFFDGQQQQIVQQQQETPVTRLEVLVVDGNWDDALESFEAAVAGATTTSFTELSLPQQQQQHELHNIQAIDFQDPYWNHQQTQQQQQQQQEQQQQQQQQHTTMPKVQHQNSDTGRSRGGAFEALPTTGQNYEDQENGNLSWLLDFKLDSFIEAPEDKSGGLLPKDLQGNKNKFNNNNNNNNRTSNTYEAAKRSTSNFDASGATRYDNNYSSTSSNSYNVGLAENRNRCQGPKKPPFTYTELIEHALQERGELTVSAIYQWISEHFPYYKSNDDRWKNSVRHNLSINPHFRKGSKAPHGAGHLWAIASQDESKTPRQLFNIASIRQALKNDEANNPMPKADSYVKQPLDYPRVVTIDEVAAATASIAQPVEEDNIIDTISLEHCAEQILSGIKKEVEVQYLVPMMVSNNGEIVHNQQSQTNGQPDSLCPVKETDFLNPVSKEVVAEECGLIGEGYLVTDLNPSSLGLNMAESEVVTTDNLFGEELSFQFYEFASASQLQSA